MKYPYIVNKNGVWYPAGTEVPDGVTPIKKEDKIIVKREKTLSEKLSYALLFQTDEGMISYLESIPNEDTNHRYRGRGYIRPWLPSCRHSGQGRRLSAGRKADSSTRRAFSPGRCCRRPIGNRRK